MKPAKRKSGTKKLKVLFIAPFPKLRYKGGINYIAEQIRDGQKFFDRKGVELIFFNSEHFQRSDKTVRKIRFINFAVSAGLIFKILAALSKEKPDILYMNTSAHLGLLKDMTILKFIRPFFKGKIIVHIHFAEFQKVFIDNRHIRNFILKVFRKTVDRIVVLSRVFKNELVSSGIKADKISLLNNFHDYSGIKTLPEKKDKKLHLIFLGSIDKRKGIIDLLEVMKSLNNRNVHLHLCGGLKDHSIEREFRQLLEELGEKVTFHGYTSGRAKKKLLLESDVLVLPSFAEGLPIVILEAFATGNAVIATDVGAIPEIVSPDNGLLFKPGDRQALERLITDLQKNRERIHKLQENNLQAAAMYAKKLFFQNLADIIKAESL